MKEIKVGTLTKEEIKEFKKLQEMRKEFEKLLAQANSGNLAFWERVRAEHGLTQRNHYISGNSICRQDIE